MGRRPSSGSSLNLGERRFRAERGGGRMGGEGAEVAGVEEAEIVPVRGTERRTGTG